MGTHMGTWSHILQLSPIPLPTSRQQADNIKPSEPENVLVQALHGAIGLKIFPSFWIGVRLHS